MDATTGKNGVRVAVLLRTNRKNPKTLDSIAMLSGSEKYDLFIYANETAGEIDFGSSRKVSHSLAELAAEYSFIKEEKHCILYSDVLFKFAKDKIPGYDYYLLVEDDIHFTSGTPRYLEQICSELGSRDKKIDLFSTWYRRIPKPEDYQFWGEACFKTFGSASAIFFPIVGLSARAIDYLIEQRQAESQRFPDKEFLVFCELFVPTVLDLAGDFVTVDMNEMVANSYSHDSFKYGLPLPLLHSNLTSYPVEMLHSVYDMENCLKRHHQHGLHTADPKYLLRFIIQNKLPFDNEFVREYALQALVGIEVARNP